MKKSIIVTWCIVLGLLGRVLGDVVIFNDTFQAPHNSLINQNLETRQSSGLVSANYYFTEAGRAENEIAIKDRNSDGESAMGITTFTQANADSWGAIRLSPDFSSYLSRKKYSIHLNAQFGVITGGTANDFWLGCGILGHGEAAEVPTSSNTDFGCRINASGGGYGIYTNGISVADFGTGSTLTWNERFDLTLIVDETGDIFSVQILLQGASDPTAVDLGTYTFSFDPGETERSICLRVNQTNSGQANGVLYLDVYEMTVSEVVYEPWGYNVWSNDYELIEGPEGDDDQDGAINLYEFAVGGNPTNSADQGNSSAYYMGENNGTNGMIYVYPMMSDTNSGLSYYLELTDDLVSQEWTNAGYAVLGTGANVYEAGFDAVTNWIPAEDISKFIRFGINQVQ